MKSVQEVMGEERSANQAAFAAWLIGESGLEFKSAAAEDAFKLGAVLGHACYKLFQVTKPTSVIAQRAMEEVPEVAAKPSAPKAKVPAVKVEPVPAAEVAPAKATPRARTRKDAPGAK